LEPAAAIVTAPRIHARICLIERSLLEAFLGHFLTFLRGLVLSLTFSYFSAWSCLVFATTFLSHADNIDRDRLQCLFDEYDVDKDGAITVAELEKMLVTLGVAPLKEMSKRGSASSDKSPKEPGAEA
jgi:hypothetical protein